MSNNEEYSIDIYINNIYCRKCSLGDIQFSYKEFCLLNKYLAEVIDYCGLFQLHRKKSLQSHYYKSRKTPPAPGDITCFYAEPSLPEINFSNVVQQGNYQMGRFLFKSEIQTEYESNNLASGISCRNQKKGQKNSVILVHGWRTSNLDRAKNMFLDRLMGLGCDIYFIALPYHF
jgi:hypothetical protein